MTSSIDVADNGTGRAARCANALGDVDVAQQAPA
jgi:hypothetical protein